MIGEEALRVFVLLGAAGGCMPSNSSPNPDAKTAPIIMYEPSFTSKTWSLSITGSAAQLSISDVSGPAACALSPDQKQSLPAGGGQIILRLPGVVTGTCPVKTYTINTHCAATLGTEAYVPEGCAFYRKWDAQGQLIGFTAALSGEIGFSGSDTQCLIRANVGFLGAIFDEQKEMMNGAGMQPWCMN